MHFAGHARDNFASGAKIILARNVPLHIMRGMTLDQYMTEHGLSNVAFAPLLGVDQSTVHRLRKGQIPGKELMAVIFEKTGGAVRADDFFGIDT